MSVYASVAALIQITFLYCVPPCPRFRENYCILKYLLPGGNGFWSGGASIPYYEHLVLEVA